MIHYDDRLLPYLEAIGDRGHVWLYTSGMHMTERRLRRLRELGLDELRINIAAAGYDLEKVALAAGQIDIVTVEVPAIPEHLDVMGSRLHDLAGLGVAHLNLHQLYATPSNRGALVDRGHHVATADEPARSSPVVHSELAALRIIKQVIDHHLSLPVHYCPYAFKSNVQQARASARLGEAVASRLEVVTGAGYLRRLALVDEPRRLEYVVNALRARGADPRQWSRSDDRASLTVHPSLLNLMDVELGRIRLSYAKPMLRSTRGPDGIGIELPLHASRSVWAACRELSQIESGPGIPPRALGRLLAESDQGVPAVGPPRGAGNRLLDDLARQLAPWERIEEGLY